MGSFLHQRRCSPLPLKIVERGSKFQYLLKTFSDLISSHEQSYFGLWLPHSFQIFLTCRGVTMVSSIGIHLCVCVDSIVPRESNSVDSHHGEKDLVTLESL